MSSRLDEILADFKVWTHDYSETKGQTHTQIQPAQAKAEIKSLMLDLVTEVFDEDEEIVQIFRKKLEEL